MLKYLTDVKDLFDKIKKGRLDLELSGFKCNATFALINCIECFFCKAKKETIEYVHLSGLSEANCKE